MVDRKYCVYCHTSPSGKHYVGITGQRPTRRWNNGEGYRESPHFYKAILKYGWENIKHEILYDKLSLDEAREKEIELIRRYNSDNPQYGYNLSKGGESGFAGCSWSEERRKSAQQAMLGNKYCLGYKHTRETRRKMSEAQLRREHPPLTEEQKAKCIANLPPPRLGADNPSARSVVCIETNKVYVCIKYAAEDLGVQASHISQVCNGKRNTTDGYHFKFLEKQTEVVV